jgi:hypothetical protein
MWVDGIVLHCNHFQPVKSAADSIKMKAAMQLKLLRKSSCVVKWKDSNGNFSSMTKEMKCLEDKGATLEGLVALGKKNSQ